jgi:hypothetical protein
MVVPAKAGPRATRGQETQGVEEAHAKRTQSEQITDEIQRLRDLYGQTLGRNAKAIPFNEAEKFFQKIEEFTRATHVFDACERVETAAKQVEKVVGKLEDRWKEKVTPTSYAQAVRGRLAGASQGPAVRSLTANQRETKRVIIKIPNKEEAELIKERSREEIAERTERAISETHANHRVIAVEKLRSGDLAIHMDSTTAKKDLEADAEWAKTVTPGAIVHQRTWQVLIHGVRVASYSSDTWEEYAKRMEKENIRLHPGLKILGMRWIGRTTRQEYAPLVVEVGQATQANRMINEGVVIAYDLKIVERYEPKCRIIQCFKCQRYGHISTQCRGTQKCGHCGGNHGTIDCADGTHAKRRSCAACDGGEHASWSTACPARIRETKRAKTTRLTMATLYPTPSEPTINNQAESPATSIRFVGASQTPEGWTLASSVKKRKFNTPGRPTGAINKAKTITPDAATQTLSFLSQQSRQNATEKQASNPLITDTQESIDLMSTQ